MNIGLDGKKILVMGVTNKFSLGWAIAEVARTHGAELAFSYQADRQPAALEKLTADMDGALLYQCDVTNEDELKRMMADLGETWGGLDGIVHAIAFAPRPAMEGRYIETNKGDWLTALEVSAYSLLAVAREAEGILNPGAGLITLTYYAAEKVVPKYNVMGVAKSALESTVRYLAYDLGKNEVRVNAVSAGPVKTVAARSIPGFMQMYGKFSSMAPLKSGMEPADVGNLGAYLLSPMAAGITGETVYVDAGYHAMGMDLPEESGQ